MTVTCEQEAAVMVSAAQNGSVWRDGGDESRGAGTAGEVSWNAAMPNGDPASLMLWGADDSQ